MIVISIAWASTQIRAQQTGEITGTVTDSTGAVISGAALTVTNTVTQQVRVVNSNDSGSYTVPYLLPGHYDVKAEKPGLKVTTQAGVVVQVGGVARIGFKLDVRGNFAASRREYRRTIALFRIGFVRNRYETKQITDLPLNGRDYLSLVALSPNVVSEAPSTGGSTLQGGVRAATALSVAGQRLEFNP